MVSAATARVRAALEAREALLAPGAAREADSAGRDRPEPPDPLRLAWQIDRDRIIHTAPSGGSSTRPRSSSRPTPTTSSRA